MSFEKAIRYRKVKRRQYRGAASFDRSCRPHGACSWCRTNRLYSRMKAKAAARHQEAEWLFPLPPTTGDMPGPETN